jgi:very-short-patch-repair endonuclease/predicted transcriptional regulator of viral defense system
MRGSPKPPGLEAQHECCLTGNKCIELPDEALIVALAERQHAVVTLSQLQLLGLGRSGVSRRVRSGRLHRVHRGVYAVGRPSLTRHGRWMAAVLACGPKALLSHRSVGALHGIRQDNRAKTDVTVPRPSARSRPTIDVHASLTLESRDVTSVDGIPCTTVARTLVDLGDVVSRREVERAVDRAELLRVFDGRAVHDVLARAGRRKGAGTLRAILDGYEQPKLTRTEVEERFLALCRNASLPSPVVNEPIVLDDGITYEPDFLWRAEKLIAETDGRDVHTTRKAFEHDRLRDQRLTMAGFTIVRFTWRQVTREPQRIAGALQALLARLARP